MLIQIAFYASANGVILCFSQGLKTGCFRDRLRDTNEVYQAVGNRLGSIHLQLQRNARAKTLCLFCRLLFNRANQRKGFLRTMSHAIVFIIAG